MGPSARSCSAECKAHRTWGLEPAGMYGPRERDRVLATSRRTCAEEQCSEVWAWQGLPRDPFQIMYMEASFGIKALGMLSELEPPCCCLSWVSQDSVKQHRGVLAFVYRPVESKQHALLSCPVKLLPLFLNFWFWRLKATLERLQRLTQGYTDQLLNLFPARASALGSALGLPKETIQVIFW